jgi:hypothetical protein
MNTPDANPILLHRASVAVPRRAVESALGTLIPGRDLQLHTWSEIAATPQESVGTRIAPAWPPRWPAAVALVA